jgi:hypothetical protein
MGYVFPVNKLKTLYIFFFEARCVWFMLIPELRVVILLPPSNMLHLHGGGCTTDMH